MAFDTLQRNRATLLDHLHAPAHAKYRQSPRFRQVQKRVLGSVPLRCIAAESGEVIASSQDQTGNVRVCK